MLIRKKINKEIRKSMLSNDSENMSQFIKSRNSNIYMQNNRNSLVIKNPYDNKIKKIQNYKENIVKTEIKDNFINLNQNLYNKKITKFKDSILIPKKIKKIKSNYVFKNLEFEKKDKFDLEKNKNFKIYSTKNIKKSKNKFFSPYLEFKNFKKKYFK